MSLSEHLSDAAEDDRRGRESRTAIAAAMRDAVRNSGTTRVPDHILAALRRHDGTSTTLRDRKPEQNDRSTNHNDDITAPATSLETSREDY